MLSWIKAMLREWPLTAYAVLSLISTIATYSKPFVPGHVRLLVALSALVAFVAASIRVDVKRQKEIAELTAKLVEAPSKPAPKAELLIHPGGRSGYVMLRANDQHPLPPKGLYIELDLSIENKGNRMSTIKHISLAFPQFEKIYTEVKPYFTARVPGTRGTLGRVREHFFPPEDFIRIPSESVTGPKMLAFEILDLPLSSFGKRAFEGERETLVFPAIRCELKVTDTEGYSTSHEFLLDEEK